MLGGASGANTGHFASFFYYTRARALLEGELAAEARKIEYKTKEEKNQSIFRRGKLILDGLLVSQLCQDLTRVLGTL